MKNFLIVLNIFQMLLSISNMCTTKFAIHDFYGVIKPPYKMLSPPI